jgi:hypothetical protein
VVAILEGIRATLYLYVAIDEPEIAWRTAAELFNDLSMAGLNDAKWKARLIRPVSREDLPEEFWAQAQATCAEGRDFCLGLANSGPRQDLAITMSAADLAATASPVVAGPTTP